MSATATQIPMSQIPDAGGAEWPDETGSAIETVIQPSRGWLAVPWAEMAHQRELLFFLIWRDIKVRYKQSVLGIAWAVLQPVINMIVFTAIFGVAAGLNKNIPKDLPYAIFVFAGLLPWQLFATSLNTGGLSLVNQQHLLTKIYFPRLFVPTAAVGGAVFDMAIASVAFIAMLVFKSFVGPWHFQPTWMLLLLPVLLVLNLMLALGTAYLLSALTVSYRDFRFLIPFMVQIWMWMSFVAFPVPPSIASSPKWAWVFAMNPMHGIIAGYRKAILVDVDSGWSPVYLLSSAAISVFVFVLGIFYFRRTERRFADIA
jgi:lipopolysaccharide transport system permease protein